MKLLHSLSTTLLLLASSVSLHAEEPKNDSTTAKQIIEKAMDAIGDKEALKKMKCTTWSSKGERCSTPATDGKEAVLQSLRRHNSAEFPNKLRMTRSIKHGGQKFEVVTAIVDDEAVETVNGVLSEQVLEWQRVLDTSLEYWACRITPLLDEKRFSVTRERDDRVGDEEVYVLAVAPKQGMYKVKELKLYISKKSGLLLKSTRKVPRFVLPLMTPNPSEQELKAKMAEFEKAEQDSERILRETVYSEFRKTDGFTMPMKVKITEGGAFEEEFTITEIKHSEKADEGAFELK